jgi:hypothetical protein
MPRVFWTKEKERILRSVRPAVSDHDANSVTLGAIGLVVLWFVLVTVAGVGASADTPTPIPEWFIGWFRR